MADFQTRIHKKYKVFGRFYEKKACTRNTGNTGKKHKLYREPCTAEHSLHMAHTHSCAIPGIHSIPSIHSWYSPQYRLCTMCHASPYSKSHVLRNFRRTWLSLHPVHCTMCYACRDCFIRRYRPIQKVRASEPTTEQSFLKMGRTSYIST